MKTEPSSAIDRTGRQENIVTGDRRQIGSQLSPFPDDLSRSISQHRFAGTTGTRQSENFLLSNQSIFFELLPPRRQVQTGLRVPKQLVAQAGQLRSDGIKKSSAAD